MSSTKVKARVRCVIDIPVGVWGSDGNIGQLTEQVRREGETIIRNLVQKAGGAIYGDPKVVFVMTEEE